MKSTDTLNPFVFIALIIADGLVGKTVQAFQPQNHVRQKTMKSSTSHTTTRLQAFELVEGSTAVDAFFHSQPYLASLLTCMVPSRRRQPTCWHNRKKNNINNVNAGGEQPFDFDVLRNLAFVLYGGLYQGLMQTFIYTQNVSNLVWIRAYRHIRCVSSQHR